MQNIDVSRAVSRILEAETSQGGGVLVPAAAEDFNAQILNEYFVLIETQLFLKDVDEPKARHRTLFGCPVAFLGEGIFVDMFYENIFR